MLSLAAGALLATAFLHLLPEAFEAGVEPHNLFMTLLFGLLFFFLLDKAELWHHGHEHHHGDAHHGHDHHEAHDHDHAHSHATDTPHDPDAHAKPQAGGWAILAGDSVHCFGDGVLIASAFMVDLKLGVVAALAVLAHEVPHHMGDLVVLRQGSQSRQTAVLKVSLAGAITALGGLAGYALLDQLHGVLPYMLAIASSSFIYVALADLIPQLQKRLSSRETAAQIVWLMSGIALVSAVSLLAHSFILH
jgi:zinc and cadmium transporter